MAHLRRVRVLLHRDGGPDHSGDCALAGDEVQGQGQADAEHTLEPGAEPVHDGVVGRQLVVPGKRNKDSGRAQQRVAPESAFMGD